MAQPEIVRKLLENRDLLLGFIYALTRDYAVAEEVFQETSLAILEESQKLTKVENFPAWSREIARRRVAEYYRKTSRRQGLEQLSGSMAEIIAQAFVENELTSDVQQTRMKYLLECLERLAGRSRDIVVRFYQRRESLKDIAAALKWQPDSVKVSLSRTRKSLADCIETKMAQETHGK
jgi:RNA polymerase sigma-70 factor, ECF subfamily